MAFAAAPGESSRAEERTQLGDCENSDGLPVTQDTDPNFDKKKEAWRFISSRVQVLSESSSDGEEQDEPAQTYERYSTREMNREDRQDGYQVENGGVYCSDSPLSIDVVVSPSRSAHAPSYPLWLIVLLYTMAFFSLKQRQQ